MKIGTDAVLLGIWTDIKNADKILDVGTGSGIIALLLASRTKMSKIDAIELDKLSYEEAFDNFAMSPFAQRMTIINDNFINFANNSSRSYNLIVSNPPFFINDFISKNRRKTLAKHALSLSYEKLLNGVSMLLNTNGIFCLVIPYAQKQYFLQLATNKKLFLQKEMYIFPKYCQEPNRINMQLGFEKKETKTEKLIIRNTDGSFTHQYINMVEDYYLWIKQSKVELKNYLPS